MWNLKVFLHYAAAIVLVLPLCVLTSLVTILPWVDGDSDSPVYGSLWAFIFIVEAALLVPVAIGISGELAERSRQQRRFQSKQAMIRCMFALLSEAGPLCAVFFWGAAPTTLIEHRPTLLAGSWLITCVAVIYAFRVSAGAAFVGPPTAH